MLFGVLIVSVLGLAIAGILAREVVADKTADPKRAEVALAIREGAQAFLKRQNTTIVLLALAVAAIVAGANGYAHGGAAAVRTGLAFVLGAGCSVLSGYVGMWVSIRANLRTAEAAARSGIGKACQVALRGGAVSGIMVVSLSLLGVGTLFLSYGGMASEALAKQAPFDMVAFGFGASFVALFAQLGGGIYTKAADVGADLVGKVESGIPEDDPRNPAVIADLVGDNVGDCAGRGADLFESTAAENIGAMILGVALWPAFGLNGILFPLVMRAVGLIASILGIYMVPAKDVENPMSLLNRGYLISSLLSTVGLGISTKLLLGNVNGVASDAWMWFFGCGIIGILCAWAFVLITQYYTESQYRPVKSIVESCKTGPATNIITGMAVGMECVALPAVTLVLAIMGSHWLGEQSQIPHGGLYGTAIATMGMLATCAYILAMDTFGPITDNAGGIVEMSGTGHNIRKVTDNLDSVGNTTKAITKGYAIGSAGLAAFLLFSAYMDEVTHLLRATGRLAADASFGSVDITKVGVFSGGLLGAALVFLFSSLAIRAVGRCAQTVIQAVREQFKAHPGIMAGTEKPDYAACVDIVTRGALVEMILPGCLAVAAPIVVGLVLRAEAVAAMLMVGTITGILVASFLNNSGGAWDNAKKAIESGLLGGKGSDAHKAAVVGDTVGDPFKDTAGPSIHVLIKLLATVTLVFAPLFV